MKTAKRSRHRKQIRPPNYFAKIYNQTEIREDNRLAKALVIRAPKDLE